jgi:hypothetical protein
MRDAHDDEKAAEGRPLQRIKQNASRSQAASSLAQQLNSKHPTITTSMKLEVSVHAQKLKNVAGAFKGTSDPFAVVTQIASAPGGR